MQNRDDKFYQVNPFNLITSDNGHELKKEIQAFYSDTSLAEIQRFLTESSTATLQHHLKERVDQDFIIDHQYNYQLLNALLTKIYMLTIKFESHGIN